MTKAKLAHLRPTIGSKLRASGRRVAKKKLANKWTEGEYSSLISLVRTQGEDWSKIAAKLPNKTAKQCMQKFKNSQRSAKKGNWMPEEDDILLRWVGENGATKWTECSKLIRGRCGKQCRERWVNILNPCVKKGNWSDEEQGLIFENLHRYHTSWSAMSKVLPGRTENSIKNYFYSSIRRLKSNPITHLLKDIYVSKKTSIAQVQENNSYLNSEIGKLNRLSQEICRFLLRPNTPEDSFKQFLISVLFTEEGVGPESLSAPRSDPIQNSVQIAVPSIPTLNKEHSPEETRAIFEMVRRFIEKSGNPADVNSMLKAIEDHMERKNSPSQSPKVITLKIPYCWNCCNESCAKHAQTPDKKQF